MAESTLNLKFSDLCTEVAMFVGFAPKEEDRPDDDNERVKRIVASGLRQFYIPKPAFGQTVPYQWSFLSPVAEITLAADANTIAMPDDFAYVVGNINFATDDDGNGWDVPVMGIGSVIQRHNAFNTTTGRPQIACVRPLKKSTIDEAPRWEIYVWPTANTAYTGTLRYKIHPDALNGLRPYAYGGMAHAETIRAACLMAAEETLDNVRGIWAAKFEERLMASIGEDSRSKEHLLGYNGDRSDWTWRYRRRDCQHPTVTVGGIDPEL